MSLGVQSGLPWSKVNAAQQAGNLMLECFGRNDAHAFVEDECFFFSPIKNEVFASYWLMVVQECGKMTIWLKDSNFFDFTVFVILNFCGCDARGI